MQGYSPFDRAFDDLTAADLAALRTIPEGWYVEYKSQFPEATSIAKSLCAFANSYGGWLFYGIAETQDKQRVAGSFSGIEASQLHIFEQKIRQAASIQINPSPFFEVRALRGPNESIGLSKDRGVLVVRIPPGNNAPYVHSSGRIYRRIADSSDPVAETDRHFLDLLWRRGRETRRTFSKFVTRKPELSDAERKVSFIKLCFFPDPWLERGLRSRLDFSTFAQIMRREGVPFDNIFTSSVGFIARQASRNDPSSQVLTWRYYFDCTSEITVPINSFQYDDVRTLRTFLDGYEQAESFINVCAASGFKYGSVIDLSILLVALAAISKRRLELYEQEGLQDADFFKAHLRGVWRRIPFIDIPEVVQFSKDYGLPVVQTNRCFAPAGDQPDSCLSLITEHEMRKRGEIPRDSIYFGYVDACVMLAFICRALGIPDQVLGIGQQKEDGVPDALARMFELGARAQKVMQNRSIQDRY